MNTSFKSYLLQELTVDVDPNDPASLTSVKQTINKAKQNPQRVARDQVVNANEKLRAAQKAETSPNKALDVKIAKLQQQIASLQSQKQAKTKATESFDYPKDNFEVVYVNEHDEVVHAGSVLSESAMQAFKRKGNVIKRQYRCTNGKKEGKIVANPTDCNKRKNPKKVKAGKRAARKHVNLRISKTKISKNKSISKMVTSLNKKLKG